MGGPDVGIRRMPTTYGGHTPSTYIGGTQEDCMAKYRVKLEKTTTWVTEVEVEADDADLAADRAESIATEEMDDGGETIPPWGRTDWSEITDESIQVEGESELVDG